MTEENFELSTYQYAKLRGVPVRFCNGMDTISSVVGDDVRKDALKWCAEFKTGTPEFRGRYISGGLGTGKTALAYAMAIEVMKQGKDAYIETFSGILMKIRSSFRSDSEQSEIALMNNYVKCPLLVLDDLGQEPPTEFAAVKLYDIVNERYNHCRPIIVTSNLDGKSLQAKADDAGWRDEWRRVIDRFVDMLAPIRLDGKSKRGG